MESNVAFQVVVQVSDQYRVPLTQRLGRPAPVDLVDLRGQPRHGIALVGVSRRFANPSTVNVILDGPEAGAFLAIDAAVP
jgi:hypothetical protein